MPARERERKRNKRESRLKSLRSIDMMADAPSEKAYIAELLFLFLFFSLLVAFALYIYRERDPYNMAKKIETGFFLGDDIY